MKRHLIGIIGRSRVGKDTTARLIQEILPNASFELHHIAKPLKEGIAHMYCLSNEQLHGNLKDVVDMRYGHSPRELCTIWNNKLTHLHGPKFLIHRFFELHDPSPKNLIIPDVRFNHDCYEIRQRRGILVKIVKHRTSGIALSEENHIDQLPADVTLQNDSTIETLRKSIMEHVIPLIKT